MPQEVELEFPGGTNYEQYDEFGFDDSEFNDDYGDYGDEYGNEYDENDIYYDEEDDYGDYYDEEYDEEEDLPHPSYQSGFFKDNSPINRFMQDRNKSFKKNANVGPVNNHSNNGEHKGKFSDLNRLKNLNKKKENPYYKLLDWSMPDLEISVSEPEQRYVKQAVLLHHGIDMSADSWFFKDDPDDSGVPIPI